MEAVFLHCQTRPPSGPSSLLRTAQNLLDPFPRRTAPVFTPWFPPAPHRPRPLRPARPPPTITCPDPPAPPVPPPSQSWMVSTQRRGRSPGEDVMSKRLRDTLSVHKLHPLERGRWVVLQENCGPRTDLDQVWRVLCRTLRTAPLPSCTATFQRDLDQVWVFCDLQEAEQVGRVLKGALQLQGRIRLSLRTRPDLLSM